MKMRRVALRLIEPRSGVITDADGDIKKVLLAHPSAHLNIFHSLMSKLRAYVQVALPNQVSRKFILHDIKIGSI